MHSPIIDEIVGITSPEEIRVLAQHYPLPIATFNTASTGNPTIY